MPEGNGIIGGIAVRIGADLTEFRKVSKQIDRALEPVRNKMRSIGGGLTQFVSVPLVGLGIAAVKAAADTEKLRKGLESAMGGAEAASAEFQRLKEAAKNPGLGFEQALRGSVRLQAVGFSAGAAREALLQFGNAIALAGGDAQDLDGVALALTQIASKGQVSAEEINQIAERVPQVRKAMQDAFGTASSEAIQKLGITAQQFVAGIVGELGKLERAQGGLANAFENAGMTIRDSLSRIGDVINKNLDIQAIVEAVTGALGHVIDAFEGLSPAVQKTVVGIAALASVIGPFLVGLGHALKIVGPLKAGFALLTGPIGLTIAGVTALAGAAFLIYRNWEGVTSFFSNLWEGVTGVVSAAAGIIMERLSQIWPRAQRAFLEGIQGLIGPLHRFAEFLGAEGLVASIKGFRETLGDLVPDGAIAASEKRIGELRNKLTGGLLKTGVTVYGAAQGIVDSVKGAFSGITEAASGGAGGDTGGGGSFGGLAGGVRRVTDGLKAMGVQAVQTLEVEMEPRLRRVKDIAVDMGVQLRHSTEIALDAVGSAIDGISSAIGGAIAGFESFGDAAKRVLLQVVAQVAAAAVKIAALKTLLTFIPGGTALGSFVRTIAGQSGVTSGFSIQAAPQPAGLAQMQTMAVPAAGVARSTQRHTITLQLPDGYVLGQVELDQDRLRRGGHHIG